MLVAVIGVMVFTSDGKDNITNDASTTSDQTVDRSGTNLDDGAENKSRNWKTFGPSQEFSREFTFQIPQNWEAFVQGSVQSGTVKLVPQVDADFRGNFPPPGTLVAEAGIWSNGSSYIQEYRTNSEVIKDGITEISSRPIIVDGYEGEILQLAIENDGVMKYYLAKEEGPKQVSVLYLPKIGNVRESADSESEDNHEFTFYLDSDVENSTEIFNQIIESIDFLQNY